jgi:uncharacterized protein YciI
MSETSHFFLMYDLVDDYVERRGQFREQHLQAAWRSHERGELVLAGALTDPIDQAILLFRASSPEVVEEFAKADPYVKNGLVKRWRVRKWTTVAGKDASTPVHPSARAAG